MAEITNDELIRFTEIMYEKHKFQANAWPTKEQGLRAVIQGVAADTLLLSGGTLTLADWEEALATDSEKFRSFWGTEVPPIVA